jgi:hypothetical protein
MDDRLSLVVFKDSAELEQRVREELKTLCGRDPEYWSATQNSLLACCTHAARLGATAAVIQRRVQDLDFLAEFNAYYSRQFGHVGRHCARFHFFSTVPANGQGVLEYLDGQDVKASYVGFITLRPVVRTPVGASILKVHPSSGFIRCADEFPVHLGGLKLKVIGTPFMQQDNAVGACAQASIWMALRTMRKREGDRAYDPAQITGAATRYNISGRILPNRTGLTLPQVVEAIRAAGYSPHPIPFAPGVSFSLGSTLSDEQLARARQVLHAYVESEIPVLLILYPSSGGHAVVVIGHTFSDVAVQTDQISRSLVRGVAVKMTHAVSWVPQFVIHNDNSGPYLPLEQKTKTTYALDQTHVAIPLLPADVFVSGEEALEFALTLWQDMLEAVTASLTNDETLALSEQFVVRLLLLEKRKIRAWAATSTIAPEVRSQLRLGDLPRRVWVLELHLKNLYGAHAKGNTASLVGFILLDSTGDAAATAMLMVYLNLPAFTNNQHGSLIVAAEAEWKAIQIGATDPTLPFRDLDGLSV